MTALVAVVSTKAFDPLLSRSLAQELPRGDKATVAFEGLSADFSP